jgi:hypothetical protein
MMSAVTIARLGREYDRFLYASVGDDNNGMPLTILSALARVDVDPWEEASKLTRLPPESAATQLASLLGALRHTPVTDLDPARLAAPLIALLPAPRDHAPSLLRAFAQAAPAKHPQVVSTLLTVSTYLIFMLLIQWLTGSLQVPSQTQSTRPSAATIESPNPPTSSEGPQSPIK